MVTGATAPGVVTLQAWDEDGDAVVRERRVEIDPATAARIRLPDDAVLALVPVERTGAVVSVEVSDRGLSVLPLVAAGHDQRGRGRAARPALVRTGPLSRRTSRRPGRA